ncbi:MAG TPA: hypothetical protein PK198_19405 [Saprospiraceae bacterium]|nr:hypothetical protein [Saprospiraceae bacterium]HRJ13495.1 hypothetical protein [Saprospiraceae bacterium]HRK82423.1 hypothetical protein [Saprospiraceae bacterium]
MNSRHALPGISKGLIFSFFLLMQLGFCIPVEAQVFMQIERSGRPKAQRIYPGEVIQYRYQGQWYAGEIQELLFDVNMVVLTRHTVRLSDIEALRYQRRWPKPVGSQIALFGLSWSAWALIGTATDNEPGLDYRWSDAAVTATAVGAGLALPALVKKYRIVEMGKKRRLRILDLNF